MCIKGTVGKKAGNARADVIVVKVLLNYAWAKLPEADLPLTAKCDDATKVRILYFQERVMKMDKPDGRVGPKSATFKALLEFMPKDYDVAKLHGIMPNASREKIALYYPPLLTEMETRSINTPLRRCHFLAQLAHESASLLYSQEIASGEAYEGREDLGNTEKGDGKRFKGRGLIQLTGRANYKTYGDAIGTDLTVDGAWTTVATDPALAVGVAGWFWAEHDLNTLADADDVRKVTKVINGGYNGLPDRKQFLARAKWFLQV